MDDIEFPEPGKPKRERALKNVIDDKFIRQVETLAGYGFTQDQIADFMNVTRPTMFGYFKKFPELYLAWKRGKQITNANVAQSLYKAITEQGQSHLAPFWLTHQAGWVKTETKEKEVQSQQVIVVELPDNGRSVKTETLPIESNVETLQIEDQLNEQEKD